MEAVPIGSSFAREIRGVCLWEPLEAATVEELRGLLAAEGVLVFRRQALSDPELARMSRYFGEPERIVRSDWQSPEAPEVIYISNLRDAGGRSIGGLGAGELAWHCDQSYVLDPATGSMLHMVQMPSEGGATEWANLALAWETLPGALREAVRDRWAVYDYLARQSTYDDEAPMSESLRRRTPPVAHPLVCRHPVSGRPSLYLDPATAVGIEGMPDDEAVELLGELARHACRESFVYRHRWEAGDVVMWDNGFLVHRREPFPRTSVRLLKRTTVRLDPARHLVPPTRLAA